MSFHQIKLRLFYYCCKVAMSRRRPIASHIYIMTAMWNNVMHCPHIIHSAFKLCIQNRILLSIHYIYNRKKEQTNDNNKNNSRTTKTTTKSKNWNGNKTRSSTEQIKSECQCLCVPLLNIVWYSHHLHGLPITDLSNE